MKTFVLIFVSFFYFSCSLTSSKKTEKVLINIKSISKDLWEVSYTLPKLVKSVSFFRQTNQFREKNWQVIGKSLRIQKVANKEVLTSVDNKPFRNFKIQFKSYFKHTPKDYEFFQPFSDGGIIFYTGHLYLENKWSSEITIMAKNDKNIVIMGNVYKSKASWLDHRNKGTYILSLIHI